jgi:hypothetical protein
MNNTEWAGQFNSNAPDEQSRVDRAEARKIARAAIDEAARAETEKALASLGVSAEEVEQADADRRKEGPRDQRICVCGHAVSKHTIVEGRGQVVCKPSAMNCPCKSLRPVIKTNDTRCFLRKTDGPAAEHALSRGMIEVLKRNKTLEWIIPIVCDKCQKPTDKVIPTPVAQGTAGVYKKNEASSQNALLCRDCYTSL